MSWNFYINDSDWKADCPCIAKLGAVDEDCERCYGDGWIENPEWMNVANGSASLILTDLLDRPDILEQMWGELHPHQVLASLSTFDASRHVVEGYERQEERLKLDANGIGFVKGPTVIFAGYSTDRLERYAERLRDMAHKALERGQTIKASH